MATVNWNNAIKPTGADYKRLEMALTNDGSHDVLQGEMLYNSSGVALPAADANSASFVGIAAKPSYKQVYSAKVYETRMVALSGGVFNMKTTVGESYTHMTALYIGADAQTVTTSAGTAIVGYVNLPDGNTVTGAAGVFVPVLVPAKIPTAGI